MNGVHMAHCAMTGECIDGGSRRCFEVRATWSAIHAIVSLHGEEGLRQLLPYATVRTVIGEYLTRCHDGEFEEKQDEAGNADSV